MGKPETSSGNQVKNGRVKGRFAPGCSGNPSGRPHADDGSITALLRKELQHKCPGDKKGRTWREVLALACLTGALKTPALMREVLERVDGKVPQPVVGGEGGPVILKVVYEQATKS